MLKRSGPYSVLEEPRTIVPTFDSLKKGFHTHRSKCAEMCRLLQGEGKFRQGRTSRENSAVKKGGELFPRRIFGGTVPFFATAAEGLCFLRRAKRLRKRLSQPFVAQMYETGIADLVTGAGGTGPRCCGDVLS